MPQRYHLLYSDPHAHAPAISGRRGHAQRPFRHRYGTDGHGLEYGINSPVFAISVILAVVVMHDAMGIRLEAGKHAQAINELWELVNSDAAPDRKMKEVLGHTPLQVLFGGLLGMAIAFLLG